MKGILFNVFRIDVIWPAIILAFVVLLNVILKWAIRLNVILHSVILFNVILPSVIPVDSCDECEYTKCH